MKVLCLAAGLGTRLRPYTEQVPKPMIPFLGLPLFLHALDFLVQATEVTAGVVNLHHRPDQMRNFVNTYGPLLGISKWDFSDESGLLLDSGGAIHKAQVHFEAEPHFWVVNADEFLLPTEASFNLAPMIQAHLSSQAMATLLVTQHSGVGVTHGGAWANLDGQIQCFSKKSVPGLVGWHYVGVMLLSSRIYTCFSGKPQPTNLLYSTLTQAIDDGGRVQIYPADLLWRETGVLADFIKASNDLKSLQHLQKGVGQSLNSRLARLPKFPNLIPLS